MHNIHFKAIELDAEKVAYLENTFPAIKDKIIHKDFLDIDAPFENAFIVVGNFPYNISTQIVFKILEWKQYFNLFFPQPLYGIHVHDVLYLIFLLLH